MMPPHPAFVPIPSSCAFVNLSGAFFIRSEGVIGPTIGTWVGDDQADSDGQVDQRFLLTFADFALTEITNGITLKISADSVGTARIGEWIEATVLVRNSSGSLVFADAVIATAAGTELMRVHGTFRSIERRS